MKGWGRHELGGGAPRCGSRMEKALIVGEATLSRAMPMRGRMVPDEGTAGRTRSHRVSLSSRKEFRFLVQV